MLLQCVSTSSVTAYFPALAYGILGTGCTNLVYVGSSVADCQTLTLPYKMYLPLNIAFSNFILWNKAIRNSQQYPIWFPQCLRCLEKVFCSSDPPAGPGFETALFLHFSFTWFWGQLILISQTQCLVTLWPTRKTSPKICTWANFLSCWYSCDVGVGSGE